MTKRDFQKFERTPRDFYATPASAVLPLLPHLARGLTFDEPCAGAGDLMGHLYGAGYYCNFASDISPRQIPIVKLDALDIKRCWSDCFITNPPWDRKVLHPLITHLSDIAPTWLLFDADWMHTKQSIPFMPRCEKIVSVGRVSWMGNGVSGFDNCAWYLFDARNEAQTQFIARAA
jgi:hypothetical protein